MKQKEDNFVFKLKYIKIIILYFLVFSFLVLNHSEAADCHWENAVYSSEGTENIGLKVVPQSITQSGYYNEIELYEKDGNRKILILDQGSSGRVFAYSLPDKKAFTELIFLKDGLHITAFTPEKRKPAPDAVIVTDLENILLPKGRIRPDIQLFHLTKCVR